MDEIKMTQEELDKKIEEAVNKAKAEQEAELKRKHDGEMAQLRMSEKEKLDKAVKKAQDEANLTAEERAKKALEEKQKQDEEERKAKDQELEELRSKVKMRERADKLKEAGVPDIFKNDTRLLNAKDEEVDEVIKTIQKEFSQIAPKSAIIDTNVHGGNGQQKTAEELQLEQARNAGLRLRR